tara:strand:- start:691 stop:873 length:183 start_codon:yes stop_codon:yes gene_type:complete
MRHFKFEPWETSTHPEVEVIKGSRLNLYSNFSLPRLRIRALTHLDNFGATMIVEKRSFHN